MVATVTEPLPAHVDALNIHVPAAGQAPHIVEPIARWSAISLGVLVMSRLVEWMELSDDQRTVKLCGHHFRVHAWHDGSGALIVRHTCCP